MVENTSKDVKQIPFEFREDDSCMWKDVVDGFGIFVEPSWNVGYQYRRKPEPEVVKPSWPKSSMTYGELCDASDGINKGWNSEQARDVANAAIAHALETGLVVLPETTSANQSTAKRDSDLITEASRLMYNNLRRVGWPGFETVKIDYEQILAKVEG